MANPMADGGAAGDHRWWWARWGAAAALLCVPAVATRYTDEVRWTASDFAAMGVLLFGCCALYELLVRLSGHWAYRLGGAVAIGTGFLTVWSNLAVGIVGAEDNPYNLVFFAVVALALAGSAIARFRARGVARALGVVAVAQAMASVVGAQQDVRGATVAAAFAGLWCIAAALFGVAGRGRGGARGPSSR